MHCELALHLHRHNLIYFHFDIFALSRVANIPMANVVELNSFSQSLFLPLLNQCKDYFVSEKE